MRHYLSSELKVGGYYKDESDTFFKILEYSPVTGITYLAFRPGTKGDHTTKQSDSAPMEQTKLLDEVSILEGLMLFGE